MTRDKGRFIPMKRGRVGKVLAMLKGGSEVVW